MKYNELPLPPEKVKRLDGFARQYRQFGIVIEPVSFFDDRLIVRVEQKEVIGKELSKFGLVERAREMLSGEIPNDWKLTVSATNHDRKDIDSISSESVVKTLDRYGMKPKHLTNYTGIDKATISLLLSGQKELTKWHKATFYYLFKYLEHSNFSEQKAA